MPIRTLPWFLADTSRHATLAPAPSINARSAERRSRRGSKSIKTDLHHHCRAPSGVLLVSMGHNLSTRVSNGCCGWSCRANVCFADNVRNWWSTVHVKEFLTGMYSTFSQTSKSQCRFVMCDVAEVALFAIQNSAILVHKKQVLHLHYER